MRGLILSAGLGERLRPLTSTRAKPAIEFLNMPMLAFPYYWLDTLNLQELTFNTHYLPETVRTAAMHVANPNIPLHFPHEAAILGSGGGIWNSRFHLQGGRDFAVANGDGVVLCEEVDVLAQMRDFHVSKNALATLLVCPLEGVGTRIPGVWMDVYGEVTNFGKTRAKPYAECFHYASYMILNKRIWDYLPEGNSNILYDVLEPRIAEGEKVYGLRVDGMQWFETGNVQDYLAATKTCLEHLRSGSRLGQSLERILERHAAPSGAKSDIASLRLIADSAEVADSASLKGFCVIGDKAKVGSFAQLEDSVVLGSAEVASSTAFRQQVVL
jgi:NDP-sugar pyrophosphorylase family protein